MIVAEYQCIICNELITTHGLVDSFVCKRCGALYEFESIKYKISKKQKITFPPPDAAAAVNPQEVER